MEDRIALLKESLDIGTRTVETGRVRIGKTVSERIEVVDPPLQKDELDIQRVAVNRTVDAPVPTRQQGDVTIVSLHEEVTVVTRQLVLTEELHIRTRRSETHAPQQVTLLREEIAVSRSDPPAGTMPMQ